MIEMLPEVKDVLSGLKDGNTPEDLFEEYMGVLLRTWEGTMEPVHTDEEKTMATNKQKVLAGLYGLTWYGEQGQRLSRKIDANPSTFIKKRAPEGWVQWEWDLLTRNGEHPERANKI